MQFARLQFSGIPRPFKRFALAFILFFCTIAALLILRWPFSQSRVTESLETTFPAKVTYTKFRSTYFPYPGCIAEGVTFHWLASRPEAPPIVTVQNFRVQSHYWDLLFRPGYISHIFLKGFRIDVPPIGTPRESFNWHETPSRLRVAEINADGAVVTIAREDDEPPLFFDVHTARLTSVSRHQPFSYALTLHNPLPPGEIRARGQFGPWNSQDPGTTQLSGAYSFWNANLGVFHGIAGTLSSNDKFDGPLQHIEAQGDVDIPNFSVTRSRHSVHLKTTFHAYIDGINGDVSLERVGSRFLGTSVLAQGKIAGTPQGHGKTAQIDLFVEQGRIQDVIRLFVREPTPPLNGVTSLRAHVTLPPGKAPFLQRVRLSGDFGIVGGQFAKASTQEDVTTLSERARGLEHDRDKGSDHYKSKGSNKDDNKDNNEDEAAQDKDGVVSNLSGHVDLRGAIAAFSEFSFTVPGAFAQMHGTYDLETHAVNLHGTLKTDAEFSHMATGFKSVLLKPFNVFFKKKHVGAVVPAHLIGTYENPQPGLDIVSKTSPPDQPANSNR